MVGEITKEDLILQKLDHIEKKFEEQNKEIEDIKNNHLVHIHDKLDEQGKAIYDKLDEQSNDIHGLKGSF